MSLSPETTPSRSPLKADLLLLLVTIIAAAGWIFSKEAMAGMPPLLFIGSRFLLAGLILAIFDARSLSQLSTRRKVRASGVGVLFGGAMACWSLGVALSDQLGVIAFINSFGILLVPVIGPVAWLTVGRRARRDSGGGGKGGSAQPPVAPDDDPDFLRGL